jgi:hypothetical protein
MKTEMLLIDRATAKQAKDMLERAAKYFYHQDGCAYDLLYFGIVPSEIDRVALMLDSLPKAPGVER